MSPPGSTACDSATSWIASAQHYATFHVQETGVSQCGALVFSGQSGHWAATYAFNGTHLGSWSTWRKLWRGTSSTIFTDSVARHVRMDSDSVQVHFRLDPTFDLVGLLHHISATSAVPPVQTDVEAWAQIWRKIGEPAINAVTVKKDTVTIAFTNNSWKRSIDSTLVERKPPGGTFFPRGAVGAAADTFIDTGVAPGTYIYRLKHVTLPVEAGAFSPAPPRPNSGWVDTLVTVPTFPAPTGLWCDDTLEPSVKCFWTNGT
ncbi:MAG: hypothetical protein ACE5JG_12400, partial [Planctomycetota bacterium]